jgi:peptide/nickel transport system substrate-binding protein
MPFDRNLDPTSEYTSMGFALLSNLLVRPLMNYRHVAGDKGNEVVPDLAAGMPEISQDGSTYRFTLRDGVRFGPPIDREVTSHDVAFALERLATPEAGARYGFYFSSAIEGMSRFSSGEASSISGIETPDDDTIVFHLTQPTGDFLKRLAMPAAAPIPREIGECFDSPGYGRYLVATGPYMIKGSASIGTRCSELAPASGFVPEKKLILVRNPAYDFATEDLSIRSASFRRYEMSVEPDISKIYKRLESGTVDIAPSAPNLDVIRRYASRPGLRDNLHIESGDRIWYISMNLTQPPFDDVHVRRAASYIMDKDFLVRSWGGAMQGAVATHILPNAMLDGALEDYDPYPSRNHAGNLRRAAAEMKRSRYDTSGDGLCDAPACSGVLHIGRPSPPWSEMTGIIESSLRKIGIELETRPKEDAYSAIQRLPNNIPITSAPGWVKDYPDPYSFIGFLFDGRNIRRPANTNYAMVGFDRARAAELDLPAPDGPVPSIDAGIDRCVATLDTDERTECWAELDRRIMTEVVPWIPYLEANKLVVVSDAIAPYEFDQFSGEISFAHIGIDRSL